jgi:hypothetical protein
MSAKDLARLAIDPKAAILQGSWADYEEEYSAEGSEAASTGNISSSDVGTEESSGHVSDLRENPRDNDARKPARGRAARDHAGDAKSGADQHARWPHDKYEQVEHEQSNQGGRRSNERQGGHRGKTSTQVMFVVGDQNSAF